MLTKIYRVTLLIVDHDGIGEGNLKDILENARYPNRCISPDVMKIETREVDWNDEHPLNYQHTQAEEFERLFTREDSDGRS